MTLAEAARVVMLEQGKDKLWLGDLGLWGDIYDRARGNTRRHPKGRYQSVIAAVRKSELFRLDHYIKAVSWSGTRDVRHPVFMLKEQSQ